MPARIFFFDADGRDRELPADETPPQPGQHQLLWIDFLQASPAEMQRALAGLTQPEENGGPMAALLTAFTAPRLDQYGHHLALGINAAEHREHRYEPVMVKMVAWENVVITAHDQPVTFLNRFAEHLNGESKFGQFDAAAFLAALLSRHLESYRQALSAIETNIDHLDEKILNEGAERRQLEALVQLRHRVSTLRRLLGAHRLVYFSLSSPDFKVYAGDQPEALLGGLLGSYEDTVHAVGSARELILGSFDLYMTSTSQRTNDIMRVLTVVTVVLGIVAAVAGLMGMNFQADVFKSGNAGFRDVMILVAGLTVLILALGRWRRWL